MLRFTRFTKNFSRRQLSLFIAFCLLLAPALIATSVESAQRKNTKAAATPKKKATPDKKSQAKTKPTPKKTPAKSKTTKSRTETSSKNKTSVREKSKSVSKNTKNNEKTSDRERNSKSKNSKLTLAKNSKNTPKNLKNTRDKKDSKDRKSNSLSKNSSNRNRRNTERTIDPQPKRTLVKTTDSNRRRTRNSKTTERRTERQAEKLPEKLPETVPVEYPQIIVTTLSVPVRNQANPDALSLSNVKLGTVLKVTEKNPAWYKVQFSQNGKMSDGWISANSTSDLNAAAREEIYRQIVERNYKSQMDFAAASELYEFLTAVSGELPASDSSAEIELKRLLALRSALKNIAAGKKDSSPYREFINAQEKEIVYNEPAGEWLVVSNRFWDLHKKYRKSSVSETIAWEAANNPLPGECEGYVNCYLFDMRMRFGEYLNLHPTGRNAPEALKNITDYLAPIVADAQQKAVYNGPTDVTDRAEFNNLIAELRTIISRLPAADKEKTLQQLKQIAEAFR